MDLPSESTLDEPRRFAVTVFSRPAITLEELVRMLPYDAIVDFRQRRQWRAEPILVAV